MRLTHITKNYAKQIHKKTIDYLDGKVHRHAPARIRRIWGHEAGPKTIFFWGPVVKWGIVLAGLADLVERNPDEISIGQSAALMMTGIIWSRYSMVITPVNYALLSVNFFMSIIQGLLFYKSLTYHYFTDHEKDKEKSSEEH